MLLNIFLSDFPKDRVPVVLSPLLYVEAQDIPTDKYVMEFAGVPLSFALYSISTASCLFMQETSVFLQYC